MSACRWRVTSIVSRGARCGSTRAGVDTQLRLHLRRLEEMEYLIVRRGESLDRPSFTSCASTTTTTARGQREQLRGGARVPRGGCPKRRIASNDAGKREQPRGIPKALIREIEAANLEKSRHTSTKAERQSARHGGSGLMARVEKKRKPGGRARDAA